MSSEHTLNTLLELDHISKIYGDLRAVDDLTLTVPQGEWLAIVGSSGSGKTTLMNMIGCMDTPSKGSVMLEGRKLEDLNAKQLADVRKNMIGLVFQKFYLVPHLTAVENVMVAQYYHCLLYTSHPTLSPTPPLRTPPTAPAIPALTTAPMPASKRSRSTRSTPIRMLTL